jgi:LAS superfamily LD-carboxypeptidase LdcB
MAALLWVVVIVGAGLVYAGATGQAVKEEISAALTGQPSPPPREMTGPAGSTATSPGQSFASPYEPPAPTDASQLVSVGGGHRLRADAAASFRRVERAAGRSVRLVGSYRTRDEQCATRAANGCKDCTTSGAAAGCEVPTAPAGKSMHEKGIAVDVHSADRGAPAVVAAFTAEGWHRWNAAVEPWHWSYQVVG